MKKTLSIILSIIMAFSAFSVMPFSALAVESYHLWIGGKEVTPENAADVFGDGSVSYDRVSNTLTLSNANIVNTSASSENDYDYYGIYYQENTDFKVVVNGTCTIYAKDRTNGSGSSIGFYSSPRLDIGGKGTLLVYSGKTSNGYDSTGLYVGNPLTVSDATLHAYGSEADQGSSIGIYCTMLTLNNASVTAASFSSSYSCYGVYDYGDISVTDSELHCTAGYSEHNSIAIQVINSSLQATDSVIEAKSGKATGTNGVSIGIKCRASFIETNCQVTAESGDAEYSYGIQQTDYYYSWNYRVELNGGTVRAAAGNGASESFGIQTCSHDYSQYVPVKVNGAVLEAVSKNGTLSKAVTTLTPDSNTIIAAASPNSDGSNPVAPEEYTDGGNYKYIRTGKAYNFWVGEKRIDEVNCYDVFGDGTVSFNPDTKILTLDNATVNAAGNKGYGIRFSDTDIGDLKIYAKGTSTVTGKDDGTSYEAYGLYCYYYTDGTRTPSCEIMLDDGAVLNLVTPDANSMDNPHYALYSTGDLTISGKGTVNATGGALSGVCREGSYGVFSSGNLELKNGAVLNATGGDSTGTQYNYAGNSYGVNINGNIIVNDGCTLNAASGRIVSASISGITTACNIYGSLMLYGSGSAYFSSPCEYGIGLRFNPVYVSGTGSYNTDYNIYAYDWDGTFSTEGGSHAVFSPNAYGQPDSVYTLTVNGDNRKIKAFAELTDTVPAFLESGAFNLKEELEGKYKKLVIDSNHIHSLTKVPAVPATDEKAGNKEYYVCDVCGKYFENAEGTKEITDKNSVVIPKIALTPAPVLTPEEAAMPTEEKTEELVKKTNTDKKDVAGAEYQRLMLKATSKKKTITLKWKKINGASGYIIYGAPCGKKMKRLATIKNGKTVKKTFKKLKKGKYYKYIVVAYKKTAAGNRIMSKSKSVHCATPGGKKGNPTGIKLKKTRITLKKGKKTKIKATLLKKGKVATHIAKFRYESSNKKIATVDKNGNIKAKKKGTVTIYVYAQNGLCKTIKVKVK